MKMWDDLLKILVHQHTRGVCCNEIVLMQSTIEKFNADMHCDKDVCPEMELMVAVSEYLL